MKGDIDIVFVSAWRGFRLDFPFVTHRSEEKIRRLPVVHVEKQRSVRLCLQRLAILHLRWIRWWRLNPLQNGKKKKSSKEGKRLMNISFAPSWTSSSTGPFTCDGNHSSRSSSAVLPKREEEIARSTLLFSPPTLHLDIRCSSQFERFVLDKESTKKKWSCRNTNKNKNAFSGDDQFQSLININHRSGMNRNKSDVWHSISPEKRRTEDREKRKREK